jgi:hypothetical protein
MLSRTSSSAGTGLSGWTALCVLLLAFLAGTLLAEESPSVFPEDQLFTPVDMVGHEVFPTGNEDWALWGAPYQDFTPQKPPRSFPNCPKPLLSWRVGPGDEHCHPVMELPAHAVRKAVWYAAADLVPLRRDSHEEQIFARRGQANSPIALSSQDFDYPLDAGVQFMIGRRFTERLSLETTYLGSYEWGDTVFVRNNDANTLGGFGRLTSPFTGFGMPPLQGLDFNNFVLADTTSNMESLEINFRYRPDWVPYGPFDCSVLYGLRYVHIDETLNYHSESDFPAPGGTVNDLAIAADNDMIGAQLGITSHFLIYPRFWIDWDVKGGVYNNHARQRSVFETTDSNGTFTSFASGDGRDDTGFTGEVRIIGQYQFLERLTLRFGYQALWVDSLATAVSNFESNPDTLVLGPGDVFSTDHTVYHGPVLGLMWVR